MDATLTAPEPEVDTLDLPDDWLRLSDPDLSGVELHLVQAALEEPQLSCGRMVAHFESCFAQHHGRRHGVAVASGTIGTWLLLRALGLGPGDEVVASPYGWHQVAHAVTLTGARLVFADINYWSGCLDPVRAAAQIGPATKALLVGNVNGHPADWGAYEALAAERGARLFIRHGLDLQIFAKVVQDVDDLVDLLLFRFLSQAIQTHLNRRLVPRKPRASRQQTIGDGCAASQARRRL